MGNGLVSEYVTKSDEKSLVVIDSWGRIGGMLFELFLRREFLSFLIWRDSRDARMQGCA